MLIDEYINQLKAQIAADGNEIAYRKLYELFYIPLMRMAFSVYPSKEAAEEIVSDVFIKIWLNRKSLHKIEKFKSYLFKATYNKALNYLRNHKKYQYELLSDYTLDFLSPAPNPEQIMMNSELEKRIHAAIQSLPPKCRQIFLLVKENNLKYKEVGRILNISVNTIDNQMAIALKKIAESISFKLKQTKHRNFF